MRLSDDEFNRYWNWFSETINIVTSIAKERESVKREFWRIKQQSVSIGPRSAERLQELDERLHLLEGLVQIISLATNKIAGVISGVIIK